MPLPSIRLIAKECAVSTATASRALADHPSVLPKTKKRVQAVAKKMGYRRNQLVGTLMSQMRTARTMKFHGNLGIIHIPSAGQPLLLPTQLRIIEGAKARAAELGFHIDLLTLGTQDMSVRRLAQILKARSVTGVILLYSDPNPVTSEFPWEDFTAVEIDYGEREPRITTVCMDHYHTLMVALNRLYQQGYRRMGLFLDRFKDARIWFKYSAAFNAFHANEFGVKPIPTHIVEHLEQKSFMTWYKAAKPDLIIGHHARAVEWLRKGGVSVPKKTAFFNLNWTARTHPCAGLDWLPEQQGIVATEAVVSQVHRLERGLPMNPRTIMIRGQWNDGPTLRKTDA